jgi:heme/copper-type cytochrome/quinol oxidase subunit 2
MREEVIARQKERYGGVKIGSAFFGWLTAMGTAVLLTALVAAAGAAVGLGVAGSTDEAAKAANQNATTVGLVGAIALIVIMLVAYYCGGYVAGRMARFNGARQGVAVWLWAVVIAIVVAIIAAIAGTQFDILANVNAFPRIPINEGALTTGGVITVVLVALASLGGAILGGLAGMRFHRRVDRAGLGR